jgi:hypothetical protein
LILKSDQNFTGKSVARIFRVCRFFTGKSLLSTCALVSKRDLYILRGYFCGIITSTYQMSGMDQDSTEILSLAQCGGSRDLDLFEAAHDAAQQERKDQEAAQQAAHDAASRCTAGFHKQLEDAHELYRGYGRQQGAQYVRANAVEIAEAQAQRDAQREAQAQRDARTARAANRRARQFAPY